MTRCLPASFEEEFYTVANEQRAIDIVIYESRSTEKAMAIEDREPITTVNMKFTSSVPKSTPVVISMALDNSGSLHIVAVEKSNFSKLDTKFSLSNAMIDDELKTALRRQRDISVE